MSDLREAVAETLWWKQHPEWPKRWGWTEVEGSRKEQMRECADAVLAVVRERLLSDEAVEAAAVAWEPDTFIGDAPNADDALRDARTALTAALAAYEKGTTDD